MCSLRSMSKLQWHWGFVACCCCACYYLGASNEMGSSLRCKKINMGLGVLRIFPSDPQRNITPIALWNCPELRRGPDSALKCFFCLRNKYLCPMSPSPYHGPVPRTWADACNMGQARPMGPKGSAGRRAGGWPPPPPHLRGPAVRRILGAHGVGQDNVAGVCPLLARAHNIV